jgi:hypothetical protein
MKQYAALRVYKEKYELTNQEGKVILEEFFPRTYYVWELAMVLNMLSVQGWEVVFPMKNDDWYMMVK